MGALVVLLHVVVVVLAVRVVVVVLDAVLAGVDPVGVRHPVLSLVYTVHAFALFLSPEISKTFTIIIRALLLRISIY